MECAVISVKYAAYSVHCAVCSMQCAVCSMQCVVCSLQHAVCSVHSEFRPVIKLPWIPRAGFLRAATESHQGSKKNLSVLIWYLCAQDIFLQKEPYYLISCIVFLLSYGFSPKFLLKEDFNHAYISEFVANLTLQYRPPFFSKDLFFRCE